ncbi:hypothetical protein [Candidatus Epulonipiscium viviparus]|uniref:hypothetical protein n=1 Tax=Candidatus Epulonipiscium viviparus TaxID=420336 RepID=UPI002738069B|nr:hypothetical protein [Candidatus Epulopiscium viviparus]
MTKYSKLLSNVIGQKIDYFSLDALQKAKLFYDCEFYTRAGKIFFAYQEYNYALDAFLKGNDGEGIVYSYTKLGRIQNAIDAAIKFKLYALAGSLYEQIGDYPNAARFFSLKTPVKAATYYIKSDMHYEAGICYLNSERYDLAFFEFNKCKNPAEVQQGLQSLEEVAVVLYFDKKYIEAYQIFIKLKLFDSALICAYELKDKQLIKESKILIKKMSA